MPYLTHISLTQFRNFHHQDFEFNAPIIGIAGKNGTGKTNLLDAVYYLCHTKSYFQNKEFNNVQTGQNGFRIEGVWCPTLNEFQNLKNDSFPSNVEQTICVWRNGKKSIQHQGLEYAKISEHIGKYNAVMIAPDDIAIINGSSEIRRKFIDGLLAQSEPDYLEHLIIYQKNLLQKNAYLKQCLPAQINTDLLDIYDLQLAEHGSVLIEQREKIAAILPDWVNEFYDYISSDNEKTAMYYKKCASPKQLYNLIASSRKKDIEFKRSLNGPHTEEWYFSLSGNALKTHASQGQKKSFLISLKLAHIKWLKQQGKQPVLLLDDIFEKLDRSRLLKLFELLSGFALDQIFLSHTNGKELFDTLALFDKSIQLVSL